MKIDITTLMHNYAFCLSIDKKRQDFFSDVFHYHKMTVPRIFNGYTNKDIIKMFDGDHARTYAGAYNCSIGHSAIVKMAKCLDFPYVLIFEDDAYPQNNINEKFKFYLNNIPDDADVVIFGYYDLNKQFPKKSDYYFKIEHNQNSFHGSHSYLLFKKAYDKYLSAYIDNPKNPADCILSTFSKDHKIYASVEQLFIQYNNQKSNWNFIGYTYEKKYNTDLNYNFNEKIPKAQDIIYHKLIISDEIDKNYLHQFINKYRLNDYKKTNSCIVIGKHPSIVNYNMQNYIDNSNKTIIRLNSLVNNNFIKNYGSRTDLFFGCIYLKDQLKTVNNKILIEHTDILKISEDYIFIPNKWLTTGFIAILFALQIFDKVEIFGFGDGTYTENENNFYSSIDVQNIQTNHLIGYEHKMINDMIKYKYSKKLSRLELQ